jgi:hypothetical protein
MIITIYPPLERSTAALAERRGRQPLLADI